MIKKIDWLISFLGEGAVRVMLLAFMLSFWGALAYFGWLLLAFVWEIVL
jgi:hypothetical protein